MEPPPPPPLPPFAASKLRLMCSYGGHIVPRPHDKVLFYAGGESRIVSVDRRTTAGSLSAFCAHLSRTVFNNRPFHLKYQLPNEELDSLISVITDEDLANMIEENDRIAPPGRIRLFLFPIKPESIGSALFDPKSETWFSDALESTRILQKGQSADSGLLMGVGLDLEAQVETGSNGGEGKVGPESLVLETCSSFGSTNSSLSVTNSPTIGIRVPSSTSIDSEISVGNLDAPPKLNSPRTTNSVGLEESPENPFSDPSYNITTQKPVQILGYPPLSQLPDIKKQQPKHS
ncbi:hypothetical protein DH2020_016188 [Rehmannia glutinosa]|uniref:PB1 domain-containing protein n=1 Tax=Rehmannia glutinosa TaxID=99300 RepID=A0ABR0WWB3_REHGL